MKFLENSNVDVTYQSRDLLKQNIETIIHSSEHSPLILTIVEIRLAIGSTPENLPRAVKTP